MDDRLLRRESLGLLRLPGANPLTGGDGSERSGRLCPTSPIDPEGLSEGVPRIGSRDSSSSTNKGRVVRLRHCWLSQSLNLSHPSEEGGDEEETLEVVRPILRAGPRASITSTWSSSQSLVAACAHTSNGPRFLRSISRGWAPTSSQ